MAEIVALPAPGFNADVVERLEGLLAEAKAGEILSIMFVADLKGSEVACGWTGCENLYSLAGQAARIQHLIQKRLDALTNRD